MADFKPLMANNIKNIPYKEGRLYFEKDTNFLYIDRDNTRHLLYDTKASNPDIQHYSSISSFPSSGVEHRLYIDNDMGIIYIWSNNQYIAITSSNINTSNYYTTAEIDAKFGDYSNLLYTKISKPAAIINSTYEITDNIINVANLLSSNIVAGLASITPSTIDVSNQTPTTTEVTLELSRYYMWSDNSRRKYSLTVNLEPANTNLTKPAAAITGYYYPYSSGGVYSLSNVLTPLQQAGIIVSPSTIDLTNIPTAQRMIDVIFTLKQGYKWSDNTTTPISSTITLLQGESDKSGIDKSTLTETIGLSAGDILTTLYFDFPDNFYEQIGN